MHFCVDDSLGRNGRIRMATWTLEVSGSFQSLLFPFVESFVAMVLWSPCILLYIAVQFITGCGWFCLVAMQCCSQKSGFAAVVLVAL